MSYARRKFLRDERERVREREKGRERKKESVRERKGERETKMKIKTQKFILGKVYVAKYRNAQNGKVP